MNDFSNWVDYLVVCSWHHMNLMALHGRKQSKGLWAAIFTWGHELGELWHTGSFLIG
jgi:hypothetical protein